MYNTTICRDPPIHYLNYSGLGIADGVRGAACRSS